ncbi:MAG TPA: DUF4097 family beta strand repeat-containing protein [Anaerolineae bacterium]
MKRKRLVAAVLILTELAVCAGIILASWPIFGQAGATGIRWRLFTADSISVEADEEQRFSVSGPATLIVENTSGSIQVSAGTGNAITIAAHKTVWGSDQADAEAQLATLKVNAFQAGNAVTVRIEQPQEVLVVGSTRGDTVDFIITVPAEAAVTARTGSGSVTLSGTKGDADLHTDFGEISATEVSGNLKADTHSGRITVRQAQAGAMAVDLRSDFGEITIEDATGGDVQAHSGSGTISLVNVEAGGGVIATSDFGGIEFKSGRAARLTAETGSGAVTLTGLTVSGALTARSDFGELTLVQVAAASYDLRTGSGSIQLAGSMGDGPHTIETNFGSIRLTLPQDTALTLALETGFGRVQSDFPVMFSGTLDESHWRGTINGGGASLMASTDSGDISLEILKP